MPITITFQMVPNVRVGTRRGVGVLGGDIDLCDTALFGLAQKELDYIRQSMDRWTQNFDGPTTRFHGFQGDYKDCFVFKHVAKLHRFYGFLYNPLPKTSERFRLCVLTTYAKKKEHETDYAELKRVHKWRDAPATKIVVSFEFPDTDKGVKQ